MTLKEKINAILAEFAAEFELDPQDLSFDDNYACLAVDQAAVLHFRLLPENAALDVFMELGPVSPAARQEICEDMLQGNVLFQATGGAALGLDRERGLAVASLRLDVDGLNSVKFKNSLESFLNMAEFWAGRISVDDRTDTSEQGQDNFLRV